MELTDLLENYISRRRLANKTISVYRTAIRQFGEFVEDKPNTSHLTDENIIAFERWVSPGRSPYTVRERANRLKSLWRFAAQQGVVTRWPSVSPTPVPELRPRAYTVEQIRQILDGAGKMTGRVMSIPQADYWRAWVYTSWITGERTGALRKLRWNQVDLERQIMDVPGDIRKTGKAAVYAIDNECCHLLGRLGPQVGLLFPWDRSDSRFYAKFNELLILSGLQPGRKNQTQRIRRSHLTYWMMSGGNATDRAQHSSPGVTRKHYIDATMLPLDDPSTRLPPVINRMSHDSATSGMGPENLHER